MAWSRSRRSDSAGAYTVDRSALRRVYNSGECAWIQPPGENHHRSPSGPRFDARSGADRGQRAAAGDGGRYAARGTGPFEECGSGGAFELGSGHALRRSRRFAGRSAGARRARGGPNGGQVYIDGFSNGQLPPKESIREIRINSNPFSAEFDQMGYGRIEILTKPGTDKLRGPVFSSSATLRRSMRAILSPPSSLRSCRGSFRGT